MKRIVKTRPPIKYVLDVTIAYPNGIPLSLATFGFGTREKCDIAVNYKIYDASEVPFEDEEKLRDWMYEVYKEKDEMLARYYETGEFNPGEKGTRIAFSWAKIIGIMVNSPIPKVKKVKEAEAPKKPMTAYFLWANENRSRLTAKGNPPQISSKGFGKRMARTRRQIKVAKDVSRIESQIRRSK
ncbi:unnamed protein product [Caenorhabditis angaria]|uniref:HMG box domain-containing protein n=1 Tax=Caenorhabditis angaria TaxID=860376 RepID=A0A9P1IVU8_9PELO|nr:unnamed protein product [Caenorhabditis angaria]